MRRSRVLAAALALLLALVAASVVRSGASFTATASNPQTVSAVADFLPPFASSAVVQKSLGGATGYVRPGGSYRLYAHVADSGNPPSGVASATADLSALTTSAKSVALSAGSYAIAAQTYNRASTTLSAGSISAGSYGFSLSLADVLGNAATQTFAGAVVVDGTAPQASDVQAANGGAAAGTIDAGDLLTLSYNEPIDPNSLVAGWDGALLAATVDVANNGSSDTLTVSRTGTQLALGSVALNANYVSATSKFNATIQTAGASVVVTLGTIVSGSTRAGSSATMRWSPSTAAYDRAGNAASSTSVTESGGSDKDF